MAKILFDIKYRPQIESGEYMDEGEQHAKDEIISLIESRIGEILGDAQPAPVLRAELQELIKRIKEK